ncbi:MAG TPA: helicase-associated domain-containing protein, partial [Limnochordales bacterium]
LWIKGFAEAISFFEDEPFPAYRLASLVRALQRLSWMGAVFLWKARWQQGPPVSDQAGSVSVKTAPSQLRGLPPMADVAMALTSLGRALWEGLSHPKALQEACQLEPEPGSSEAEPQEEEQTREAVPGGADAAGPAARAVPVAAAGLAADGQAPGPMPPAGVTGDGGPSIVEMLNGALPPDEASCFVQPNFEVLAPRNLQADRMARLLELCSVVRADRMVQLKLEAERVAACVREGRWSPAEVMAFLAQASRHGLPQNVRFTLMEALRPLGRVQLMDGVLVRADDPEVAQAIARAAAQAGVVLEALTDECFWMERRHLQALVKAAEQAGYPVRPWVRGTWVPYPVERAAEVTAAVEAAARHAARESGRVVERKPPPSLVRGHRDLVFVAPEGDLESLAVRAGRRGGAGAGGDSRPDEQPAAAARRENLGL